VTDEINAIRHGDLLIDPETGEILSDQDVGIDHLVMLLKDGQEQEKAWAASNGALKAAIGKKLDQAGQKAAETPYGVATWRTQVRRTASAAKIPHLRDHFGLTEAEVEDILACARDIDPKLLDGLRKAASPLLLEAIDALIEEKAVSYVLLQPLRKAAPRAEKVTVDREEF